MNTKQQLRDLGALIRSRRKEKKLSQKRLASEVSIDERWLREIEKGVANPTLSLILQLVAVLDISSSHLSTLLNVKGRERLSALVGQWKGTVYQDPHDLSLAHLPYDELQPYLVQMDLHMEGSLCMGTLSIFVEETPITEEKIRVFTIEGVSVNASNLMTMKYSSQDPTIIQHGIVLFRLDDIPHKIEGSFVSYGARTKDIVRGMVHAEKINTQRLRPYLS